MMLCDQISPYIYKIDEDEEGIHFGFYKDSSLISVVYL